MGEQMQLVPASDIEQRAQAILDRRTAMNASGQDGQDIDLIRAALAKAPRLHLLWDYQPDIDIDPVTKRRLRAQDADIKVLAAMGLNASEVAKSLAKKVDQHG